MSLIILAPDVEPIPIKGIQQQEYSSSFVRRYDNRFNELGTFNIKVICVSDKSCADKP